MKKLFLVLAILVLAFGSAYADYTILENELEPYAKSADVPTDMSDLNNDVGYATTADVPTNVGAFSNDVGYITSGDVPTVVSAFSNDVGYVTASEIPAQVQSDWSETNAASAAYVANKPALITSNEVSEIARRNAGEVVDEMTSIGWEVDGIWYKLVVQPFIPPPPAETTFTLEGGTEQTYNIVGALDKQWLVDNGFYDGTSYQWLVNITSVNIGTNVTSIGDYVFSRHSGLTSVTIPDSVTSIGDQAFNECSGLTSVTIPGSVTSIVAGAFYKCTGLTNLTLLDGVTSIGGDAFHECSSLTSLTIPDSVTSIGSTAFYRGYGLTSATIGSGVTNIGWNAFGYCNNLMSVTMSGKTTNQVSGMSNYAWQLYTGCVITCSDGTLIAPNW